MIQHDESIGDGHTQAFGMNDNRVQLNIADLRQSVGDERNLRDQCRESGYVRRWGAAKALQQRSRSQLTQHCERIGFADRRWAIGNVMEELRCYTSQPHDQYRSKQLVGNSRDDDLYTCPCHRTHKDASNGRIRSQRLYVLKHLAIDGASGFGIGNSELYAPDLALMRQIGRLNFQCEGKTDLVHRTVELFIVRYKLLIRKGDPACLQELLRITFRKAAEFRAGTLK